MRPVLNGCWSRLASHSSSRSWIFTPFCQVYAPPYNKFCRPLVASYSQKDSYSSKNNQSTWSPFSVIFAEILQSFLPSNPFELVRLQGFLTTLFQGFAIRPLVASYPQEGFLIQSGLLFLGLAYVASSLGPSVAWLVVLLAPVALAGGVVRTTFIALLTSAVPSSEVGSPVLRRVCGSSGTVSMISLDSVFSVQQLAWLQLGGWSGRHSPPC